MAPLQLGGGLTLQKSRQRHTQTCWGWRRGSVSSRHPGSGKEQRELRWRGSFHETLSSLQMWVASGLSWGHSERGWPLREHPQAGWPSTPTAAPDQASAPPPLLNPRGFLPPPPPARGTSSLSFFHSFWLQVACFSIWYKPHWLITAHAIFST